MKNTYTNLSNSATLAAQTEDDPLFALRASFRYAPSSGRLRILDAVATASSTKMEWKELGARPAPLPPPRRSVTKPLVKSLPHILDDAKALKPRDYVPSHAGYRLVPIQELIDLTLNAGLPMDTLNTLPDNDTLFIPYMYRQDKAAILRPKANGNDTLRLQRPTHKPGTPPPKPSRYGRTFHKRFYYIRAPKGSLYVESKVVYYLEQDFTAPRLQIPNPLRPSRVLNYLLQGWIYYLMEAGGSVEHLPTYPDGSAITLPDTTAYAVLTNTLSLPEGARYKHYHTKADRRFPCRDGDPFNFSWDNIKPYEDWEAGYIDPHVPAKKPTPKRENKPSTRIFEFSKYAHEVDGGWEVFIPHPGKARDTVRAKASSPEVVQCATKEQALKAFKEQVSRFSGEHRSANKGTRITVTWDGVGASYKVPRKQKALVQVLGTDAPCTSKAREVYVPKHDNAVLRRINKRMREEARLRSLGLYVPPTGPQPVWKPDEE